MPHSANFSKFHKFIAAELAATRDRIRNLIGDAHWLSDGEHKEVVLRKTLRNHIPEVFHVGKGFISFENSTSNQIDILISDKTHPTLFKDGDMRIVTPDAARVIIEVKTSVQDRSKLREYLNKLADDIEMIRKSNSPIPYCWAGLFVFEKGRLSHDTILETLAEVTGDNVVRVINAVALGPDDFFRFWQKGSEISSTVDGPVWHSYEIEKLSFSYFVGNVVVDHLTWERSFRSQYAWSPAEAGKERLRKYYIALSEKRSQSFR
jgi:hypothetical protein